jgi:hypothetical protein
MFLPLWAAELGRVAAGALCVTRGHVERLPDERVRIDDPKVRAVVPGAQDDRAELRFVYRGPTVASAPLGSGELRRQIGLKLRAQDSCNLLYVMWRIEPAAGIVVSLKRNPGQRSHAECNNRGYRNLRGTVTQPPPIVAGQPHTLAALIDGRMLRVWADGALAWQGDIGAEAAGLTGPIGLRSDNGRFDVELRATPHAVSTSGCHASDEE